MYKFGIMIGLVGIVFTYIQYRHLNSKAPSVKIWFSLRMLIFVIFGAMLTIPYIQLPLPKTQHILLIDDSYSMMYYESAVQSALDTYISTHEEEDTRIYLFSETVTPLDNAVLPNTFGSGHCTDLDQAYDFIRNTSTSEGALKLTVFTDGKVTEKLPVDIPENWSVETLPFTGRLNHDVQLRSVVASSVSIKNPQQILEVTVKVASTTDGVGTLLIENEMGVLSSADITVAEGVQTLTLPCDFSYDTGRVAARIQFSLDSTPYNNRVMVTSEISTPLNYIIVSTAPSKTLESLLTSSDITYRYINPSQVSKTNLDALEYDGLILDNCDGANFTSDGVESLKDVIHNEGKGCFIIGGNNAFGLSSYKENGLETFLPVQDRLSGPEHQGDTAVVVVIDTSGSMDDTSDGAKKITLAKSGLKAIVEQLHPMDDFGIIGFSDTYEWLQPLQSVTTIQNVDDRFSTIGAKGGTLIKPSLVKAYEALNSIEGNKQRHILLITDGQGDQEHYEDLTQQLAATDISLSCIGIGDEVASDFLNDLAMRNNGTYYEVTSIKELPQIMVRDIYSNGKEVLQKGKFTLSNATYSKKLNAYVATTAKENTIILLELDNHDPLLVEHQFGAGKVAVLTTALERSWSGSFLDAIGQKMISTLIETLPLNTLDDTLLYGREGNRLIITATHDDHYISRTDVLLKGTVMTSAEDPFIHSDTFVYNTANENGIYHLNSYNKNEQLIEHQQVIVDYSAEYQLFDEPSWSAESTAFNQKAELSNPRKVKTAYIGWPLVLLLFIGSLYYRAK